MLPYSNMPGVAVRGSRLGPGALATHGSILAPWPPGPRGAFAQPHARSCCTMVNTHGAGVTAVGLPRRRPSTPTRSRASSQEPPRCGRRALDAKCRSEAHASSAVSAGGRVPVPRVTVGAGPAGSRRVGVGSRCRRAAQRLPGPLRYGRMGRPGGVGWTVQASGGPGVGSGGSDGGSGGGESPGSSGDTGGFGSREPLERSGGEGAGLSSEAGPGWEAVGWGADAEAERSGMEPGVGAGGSEGGAGGGAGGAGGRGVRGVKQHVLGSVWGAAVGTAAGAAVAAGRGALRAGMAVGGAGKAAIVAAGALVGAVAGELLLGWAREEDVETDKDVERQMDRAAERVIGRIRDARESGALDSAAAPRTQGEASEGQGEQQQ